MAIKKKAVKRKLVTQKKSATPTEELTREHIKAIKLKERAEIALSKAQNSLAQSKLKIKTSKTPAAKAKARERTLVWADKVAVAKKTLTDANVMVKQHVAEAKALVIMNARKEVAIASFVKKWERDYLKKLKKQAQIKAQKKRASVKKKIL